MKRDINFIIKSLRDVLDRGHGTIPVPRKDLRAVLDEIDWLRTIIGQRTPGA